MGVAYLIDCRRCTMDAVDAHGTRYCLHTAETGASAIVLRETPVGDCIDCPLYTEEPRTAAIYELVRRQA